MPNPKRPTEKFSISLQENGLHSLWRGIEAYDEYDKTHETLLLKDAIMFLHHGVELLMKEILVRRSPFLIFENLKEASKKQKQADTLGMGIFFLQEPPKTVTFEEAISRVDAFVRPSELSDDLQAKLTRLNQLRNQLEHYAIEADKEEVIRLLASLRDPLLELFEAQLGGIKRLQPPKVAQAWSKAQNAARFYSKLEEEVFSIVQRFQGQTVPGHLFNLEGEFTLPIFTRVLPNHRLSTAGGRFMEVDILCEGDDTRWVIEIKGALRADRVMWVLNQMYYLSHTADAQPWLIVFDEVPLHVRQEARERKVMLTGEKEWQELRSLIH